MGINTVPHSPYNPDFAPCDFWLFPKLRGCRYETIDEMKEALWKVIDMLTQEDIHGAFPKLLEQYNKCIAAGGDYFEGDYYADDVAILANTHDQAETLLHSLERAAASIGLYVNEHKTEYMCYNQTGDISTLEGTPLKLVDKFTYLGSSVESTEKDIETKLTKAWTAISRLSIIWKSDLTDKMKRSFFQAAVTSILLYGCTTWTLTKRLEKKLDGNYTRMLRAILNKSWRKHPTRHQLYGHLPPITKTIQVRRTRHAGHCWRSRDELIRDVLLWIPTHGRAKAGRPARTYIQQLCEDTGCCPEDLPRAMNDKEEWRERVRDIRATSAIWWWWLSIKVPIQKKSWNISCAPRIFNFPAIFNTLHISICLFE